VPQQNFWTLWCKGTLTEADTPTIRMGATPSGLTSAHLRHSPFFYRPDALPAAQPTVSISITETVSKIQLGESIEKTVNYFKNNKLNETEITHQERSNN